MAPHSLEDARRIRADACEESDGGSGRPDTDLAVRDVGQAGDVRRDDNALVGDEWIAGGRGFRVPHVGAVAADDAPFDRCQQRLCDRRSAPAPC